MPQRAAKVFCQGQRDHNAGRSATAAGWLPCPKRRKGDWRREDDCHCDASCCLPMMLDVAPNCTAACCLVLPASYVSTMLCRALCFKRCPSAHEGRPCLERPRKVVTSSRSLRFESFNQRHMPRLLHASSAAPQQNSATPALGKLAPKTRNPDNSTTQHTPAYAIKALKCWETPCAASQRTARPSGSQT